MSYCRWNPGIVVQCYNNTENLLYALYSYFKHEGECKNPLHCLNCNHQINKYQEKTRSKTCHVQYSNKD